MNYFWKLLLPEELKRAARLLDLQKKKQFIAARGCLRIILGRYLKIKPSHVQFQYNNYGKPVFAALHHSPLSFNLSHSGDWGVLAVVKKDAVGVDIEKIEYEIEFNQVAQHFFNERELYTLSQYPSTRQRRGFYRLWTQKEARLKSMGTGFKIAAGAVRTVVSAPFYLKTFPVAAEYVCSVAADQRIAVIKKFHFSEIFR
ncbi:MAG: 4'-phosphopantetheinyl transferase superfamily protein [Desulfuromusa sp.]